MSHLKREIECKLINIQEPRAFIRHILSLGGVETRSSRLIHDIGFKPGAVESESYPVCVYVPEIMQRPGLLDLLKFAGLEDIHTVGNSDYLELRRPTILPKRKLRLRNDSGILTFTVKEPAKKDAVDYDDRAEVEDYITDYLWFRSLLLLLNFQEKNVRDKDTNDFLFGSCYGGSTTRPIGSTVRRN